MCTEIPACEEEKGTAERQTEVIKSEGMKQAWRLLRQSQTMKAARAFRGCPHPSHLSDRRELKAQGGSVTGPRPPAS